MEASTPIAFSLICELPPCMLLYIFWMMESMWGSSSSWKVPMKLVRQASQCDETLSALSSRELRRMGNVCSKNSCLYLGFKSKATYLRVSAAACLTLGWRWTEPCWMSWRAVWRWEPEMKELSSETTNSTADLCLQSSFANRLSSLLNINSLTSLQWAAVAKL